VLAAGALWTDFSYVIEGNRLTVSDRNGMPVGSTFVRTILMLRLVAWCCTRARNRPSGVRFELPRPVRYITFRSGVSCPSLEFSPLQAGRLFCLDRIRLRLISLFSKYRYPFDE
jgi:hypothetical protein